MNNSVNDLLLGRLFQSHIKKHMFYPSAAFPFAWATHTTFLNTFHLVLLFLLHFLRAFNEFQLNPLPISNNYCLSAFRRSCLWITVILPSQCHQSKAHKHKFLHLPLAAHGICKVFSHSYFAKCCLNHSIMHPRGRQCF